MRRLTIITVALVCLLTGCRGTPAENTEKGTTQNRPVTVEKSEESTEIDTVDEATQIADEGKTAEQDTATEEPEKKEITGVKISFDYARMSGKASNQIAVWVEDGDGKVIRNIYASDFTASRRGYLAREEALSHWVSAVQPDNLTDEEIDAISSPTPDEGRQEYLWDLRDDKNRRVQPGVYYIKLEGTLFWSSNVLFTGVVDTENILSKDIEVTVQRSEPDTKDNESMITNVKISILTEE